jgi:DNA-binding NarL/FixJ family response regulator
MKNPTVLLVAGHSVIRLGLRMLLAIRPASIVGEATTAAEGERLAAELQPEIIILDSGLTDADEITALDRIARAFAPARILFISDRDDEEFVERALVSGASAYLLKETATADLKWAVQAAEKGREYFSPALILRLRGPESRIPEPAQLESQDYEANCTESRLMAFLNQGLVIRQLAQELRASIASVSRNKTANAVPGKEKLRWNLGRALLGLFGRRARVA